MGSIPKLFALASNSLKRLYLPVVSLQNFDRDLLYNWHEKIKSISISTSLKDQVYRNLRYCVSQQFLIAIIICLDKFVSLARFPTEAILE